MLCFTLIDSSIYNVDVCTYSPQYVIYASDFYPICMGVQPFLLDITSVSENCHLHSPGSGNCVLTLYTSVHVFRWSLPLFMQDPISGTFAIVFLLCKWHIQFFIVFKLLTL